MVYISGQVFIPIEINILTMLLTYQKESVQPLLAIHQLAIHPLLAIHLAIHPSSAIHHPLLAIQPSSTPSFAWKVNPIRLISKISTFMPSNDY